MTVSVTMAVGSHTMTTLEEHYVEAVVKEMGNKMSNGSHTWYHCERLDNVIHHNSWICKQVGGVDEVVTDIRRKDAVTKLVAVAWYFPRPFHTKEITRQLSKTAVTIE
jgi:hypothetical protein